MKNGIFSILALILALSSSLSSAQQVPDIAAIKAVIEEPSSPYYYPTLMGRYQLLDTTLTKQDYFYLYYGYPEQPTYMPLVANSYVDSLATIASQRTQPTPSDLYRMIYYAKGILEVEPFNLRDMNVLAFAYSLMDDKEQASKVMRAMDMIYTTIISSGSGMSEKNPWWIIYLPHAEDVMNLLRANFDKPIILSSTVEFFPVTNMPEKRYKGYYFNFAEIYARRPDYLDNIPKQKRKMELNPLYNPKSKENIFKKK